MLETGSHLLQHFKIDETYSWKPGSLESANHIFKPEFDLRIWIKLNKMKIKLLLKHLFSLRYLPEHGGKAN